MLRVESKMTQEENTAIPKRIQSKYDIVEANAAAADQAIANGQTPDIPPDVGLKIPEDNV